MTSSKSQKVTSKESGGKDGEKVERKRSGSLSLPSTTSGEFQVKISTVSFKDLNRFKGANYFESILTNLEKSFIF
jgi:hypothetical protein